MKISRIIGLIFIVFFLGAFLFTHFSSGVTTKHFENQYVSFDYLSNWTITDSSGQNMNISGSPNAHYALSMNFTDPNGVSGYLHDTTIEAMQTDNYQHMPYKNSRYNITQFVVPWGYDYYVQTKNDVYELSFVLANPNDGNQWNNAENESNIMLNSIQFTN